eukprot:GDKI01046447.1.p1 GENE.GDKI01046447.1~~GDKI01046447.1.p1  ORF type:complete len:111 (-),score=5.42 GDKI01046447.1:2-334(-)
MRLHTDTALQLGLRCSQCRFVSTSASRHARLPTGETVLRNLTKAENMAVDMQDVLSKRIFPYGAQDLFRVWRQCHTSYDYKVGLWTMNLLYNNGRPLDHYQTASRTLYAQ